MRRILFVLFMGLGLAVISTQVSWAKKTYINGIDANFHTFSQDDHERSRKSRFLLPS